MRGRNASVSAVEVSSPRAIRLPASAMLSVVSSVGWRALLIGAEHMRRFGGPGPMAGDALHQVQQSDIALVQMLDVLGRERQACQRGARAKFLDRWWCLASTSCRFLPVQSACKRHAASFDAQAQAWLAACMTRLARAVRAPNSGAPNVQAPSHCRRRPRPRRRDGNACLLPGHSAHRHDSGRHSRRPPASPTRASKASASPATRSTTRW